MNDFVSCEIAVKLKEKGYPQHWSDNDYIVENEYDDKFEVGSYYNRCFIPEHLPTIAAPTIAQVLKWLREEKGVFVDIRFNRYYQFYKYYVFTMSTESTDMYGDCSINTYEQAALAGIEYVLDNLI